MKTSNGTDNNNVVSFEDFRNKKQTKDDSAFKQAYRDCLDNYKVMQRYNIKEPTLEERQERIKASIARIDKLLRELNKCST
jgi:hypothetical protein